MIQPGSFSTVGFQYSRLNDSATFGDGVFYYKESLITIKQPLTEVLINSNTRCQLNATCQVSPCELTLEIGTWYQTLNIYTCFAAGYWM
ncbi:hypothetical protein H5410_024592 [Solanum commersonii]|uniref:Uncharacterized protein n=1 Tax=Solanum commersonii TaxID=4109 RepID=A0A9J5ZMG8_SOLCO|nr:hypothetical protein H5410_024592 [Solanum commersonii]